MIIPIPSYHTTSHTQTKFRTHFPDLIRCPPHSPCVREGDRIVFETGKAIRFFFSTIHIHRHHPKVRIHIPTLRAFTPTNQKIRRGSQVQSHRPTCKHPIRRYRLRTIQGQALGLYAQDHMPTREVCRPPPPPLNPRCPFRLLAKFKLALFKAASITRKVSSPTLPSLSLSPSASPCCDLSRSLTKTSPASRACWRSPGGPSRVAMMTALAVLPE